MKKTYQLLILFLLFSGIMYAQQRQVTGQIIDSEDGVSIPGVNVVIKGTALGTITDVDGRYTISIPDEEIVLVYSYVGYISQEVKVGVQSVIDIQMKLDLTELEEVVVIGYGSVRKSDMTGAVASLDSDEMTSVPFADPVQAMQGKVAGLQIVNTSGEPGDSPIIRLRGITTLNNNNPLIVIDGVIIDVANEDQGSSMDFINSNDIASVEVLKDASATSIFGARGSNGVILITTKQGKAGQATVSFNIEQGWETMDNKIGVMNGREFATYVNEITPGTFNNLDALPNIDWQDRIYEDYGSISNYSLSVSGGSEKSKYYVSFGYYNQEGIMPKSSQERITAKINTSFEIRKNIRMGINLSVANYEKQNAPNVVRNALWAWPIDDPNNPDGTFAEVRGGGNPLASIEYSNSQRNNLRSIGNIFAEVDFLDGFTFKTSIQGDVDFVKNRAFTPEFFVAPLQQNETSDIFKEMTYNYFWLWENTVSYFKEFNDIHRINAVVGYTAQEKINEYLNGGTENLLREDELFWYLNGGDVNGENRSVGNSGGHSALTSYLFRVNYSLRDKYLVTATGRRDASSSFGRNNRSGFFPSVALGWNVHEEAFFSSSRILNTLKVRTSWGIVGNEKIDFLKQYSTISQGGFGAVFNDQIYPGATFNTAGNPNLKWEETSQFNVGLNFEALESKLTGELDYYVKDTDGILVDLRPPGYLGLGSFETITQNAANVQNSGFEFNFLWRDKIGEIDYSFGINGSTIKNEVTGLGDVGADSVLIGGDLGNGLTVARTVVGESIGFFYGYKVIGVFQNAAELNDKPRLFNQGIGDFIYEDVNGDGVLTADDRTKIGNAIPSFIYGFNASVAYKGINVLLNFQGQVGNDIFNGKQLFRFTQLNMEDKFLDRWNGEGSSNTDPKASNSAVNFNPSTYFLENGSFLRLRTVTISYDLPVFSNIGSFRVYVRGTNLFTATKFTGYSPDIGGRQATDGVIDNGRYPTTKVFSVGMNLNF